MRILISGQTFYKKNNGQAVFSIQLAEGLAQAGHEVLVLFPSETGRAYRKYYKRLVIQTIPTLHIAHNVNVTGFSQRLVEKTIKDFQPHLIHIQDHYFLSRAVLKVAQTNYILIVGTNHFLPENLSYNFRIPAAAKSLVEKLLWRTMLQVFKRLHRVTAPSETAASILRKRQIRVPVQAISCGVDQARFHPRPQLDRTAIRKRYRLDPDKNLFLYVGRIDREKALDTLIKAVAACQIDAPIQLAIAGTGSYENGLKALGQSLGLADIVRFTGFVPADDLPRLLNSADIFVMLSQAELQSIATLEAISSGLPVLAANANALPELVQHRVNGYLIDVDGIEENAVDNIARGIRAMVDCRKLWPQMGQNSLAIAQKHSLQDTIESYVNLYQAMHGPAQQASKQQAGRKVLSRQVTTYSDSYFQ